MKDPVPLNGDDVGPEAEIVREVRPEQLPERGYLQFFFHYARSPRPIRDVANTQDAGEKVEPCIERKAENYCASCYQPNINAFANQDRRRLFLHTTCRYGGLDESGDRFIVGYIDKQRILNVEGRTVVQGPTKLVPFKEACPLEEVAPRNLRGAKKLGEEKTRTVMNHLRDADNIYHECVEEIEELEKTVPRSRVWEEDAGTVPPPKDDDLSDDDSCGC